MATIHMRVSPTIAAEYATRAIWDNPGMADFPQAAGHASVDLATAREMLADAEFQTCHEGPFGPLNRTCAWDRGVAHAYLTLATQLRESIPRAEMLEATTLPEDSCNPPLQE